MKKGLFLIVLMLLTSCNPRIDNTPENLDRVFEMSAFEIVITSGGCFAEFTDKFKVSQSPLNNNYYMECVRTGKSQIVSGAEMNALKEYLELRIGETKVTKICTGYDFIRVGTFLHAIEYTDRTCEGKFNDILNYYELVYPLESNGLD